MQKFRVASPRRTCTQQHSNYRNFKSHLAADFNSRCGYTDCSDVWFGGQNAFHIDHFLPWKKHPDRVDLKTSYANLVYCCSYVNILKSDDEGMYLDPCLEDFNTHFFRDDKGAIVPMAESEKAKYMYKRLRLYMARYQVIWTLDQLAQRMERLEELLSAGAGDREPELIQLMAQLAVEHTKYFRYLKTSQRTSVAS